jgi:hypothetical protein
MSGRWRIDPGEPQTHDHLLLETAAGDRPRHPLAQVGRKGMAQVRAARLDQCQPRVRQHRGIAHEDALARPCWRGKRYLAVWRRKPFREKMPELYFARRPSDVTVAPVIRWRRSAGKGWRRSGRRGSTLARPCWRGKRYLAVWRRKPFREKMPELPEVETTTSPSPPSSAGAGRPERDGAGPGGAARPMSAARPPLHSRRRRYRS